VFWSITSGFSASGIKANDKGKCLELTVESVHDSNNNNSIQFFFIYVLSQQLQVQLQTQHSADIGNYIMDKHNLMSRTNYRQALEEETSPY
jgi:hypothetical protein